ncbi:cytochrome P450 [Mycena rosella]|uniref:Cytochrome P450 n=1 Tax=Mycena rosella TaxID=1033263 RepID=A0AAD7G6S2_MYCRO|nr:cytochrome P450 [Mycena rosella]
MPGMIVLYALATIAVAQTVFHVFKSYLRRRKMHPGPTGVPVLGNVLQVPTSMPWYRFSEWKEQYGDVFSLDLAGQPVVILNTYKAAADLFDRRSTIYSDRPRLIMASEILTGGIFMIFAKYGEVWRKMRRASHEAFNLRASEKYQPDQCKEAALNVLDLINEPDLWVDHLKQTTASSILSAVYAWPRIGSKDMPIIHRIHAHTARISGAVVPGAFLVEIFPWMKRFPTWMAKWKRDGLEWHEQETQMFEKLNAAVAEDMATGKSDHCFVRELVETEQRHGLSKKESAWLAGIMFSAGAETTLGTLLNFVLAMTLYPEVMRKAQGELDTVVGRERPPKFEDKDNLPYIRAIIRETMRWRPVSPLAVPRCTTEDDWYDGYFIPKGTNVIPNVWAMNRDPKIFPDFDEFRPERFLDVTETFDDVPPNTHGLGHATFGFGRRICVGMSFASQVLFIQMAMLLWAFNFEKPLDSHGKPITPSKAECIDAGVVVLPAAFKTNLVPRRADVRSVIQRELENMA